MKLDAIRPLYDHPGPFASVYLDTDRSLEGFANVIQRRWAGLRERLTEAGAPDEVLDPIGELLLDPSHSAPGRAVFARGSDILLTAPLSAPPRRDIARWGPLPHVMPLLAQLGEPVPHIRVLADHAGADVVVVTGSGRRELSVEATDRPLQKTGQGGWSQRHYEQNVEETWRRNAAAVAGIVDREAQRTGAEVIVLAGDPKARCLVIDQLGKESARRLTVADHGSRAPGAGLEHFDAEVERACAAWADARRALLLDAYAAGQSVTGLQETTRALRDRRVRTVLLRDDPSSTATAWIGPEPAQVSTDRADLLDWGVREPVEERADAALARATAATDAEVWFVEEIASRDGVGALLRF
ncbi:Vms1/Ankzf1 family peptidyl-tRNA hydrolase [Microbispora sp. NPDC049125]|uniref:baeRF2 domain-containing protein n=1 Tax=Microbispora sp. NPDC049125 TaxID=3154929 RepID=UPI0034653111